MREIKFRAWFPDGHWYTPTERMLYDVQDKTCMEFLSFNDEDEGIIYMQYTGLKDKNGKEIYEGDIIREVTVYPGKGGLTLKFVVDFELGAFHAGTIRKDGTFFGDYLLGQINQPEIIGNIYENSQTNQIKEL